MVLLYLEPHLARYCRLGAASTATWLISERCVLSCRLSHQLIQPHLLQQPVLRKSEPLLLQLQSQQLVVIGHIYLQSILRTQANFGMLFSVSTVLRWGRANSSDGRENPVRCEVVDSARDDAVASGALELCLSRFTSKDWLQLDRVCGRYSSSSWSLSSLKQDTNAFELCLPVGVDEAADLDG